MKRIAMKKLVLNKETLTNQVLARTAGGIISTEWCTNCLSDCNKTGNKTCPGVTTC